MLFCVLPCSCQPFFAVRRHQPDRKSGLVQYIGHATFRRTAFQAAQQRVLPAEILQSAFQAGIEGVDTGNRLALIPVADEFVDFVFPIADLNVPSLIFITGDAIISLVSASID